MTAKNKLASYYYLQPPLRAYDLYQKSCFLRTTTVYRAFPAYEFFVQGEFRSLSSQGHAAGSEIHVGVARQVCMISPCWFFHVQYVDRTTAVELKRAGRTTSPAVEHVRF